MVTRDEQGDFTFTDQEIQQPELKAFFASLGNDFPEGYTTEYNPGISQFAREAGKSLDSGLLITIDYGHLQHDLYHPDRSTGTLQTFHAHTKAENPLLYPGEIDITTHIDFSRLQSSCEQAGFQLSGSFEHLGGHLGLGADDEPVVGWDDLEQFFRAEASIDVHLDVWVAAEEFHSFVRNGIRYENSLSWHDGRGLSADRRNVKTLHPYFL